ncbi:hypothetical protein LTR37_020732 [Vermiconidia calcicola]|uniref:Uncharacterized protein n=1 Tax=Vermiconidia calcicola TaxID=1690605 RepID=A0ACC3MAN1_9PEZI|nr:hypothetical protein LTR37_020732 [Vermiconidia calcicola]
MASSTAGNCCVCGHQTSQWCSKCSEGVDKDGNAAPTFYCGRECQAADYKDHSKGPCKAANARKQLYRGALLLQDLFYAYREIAFDLDMINVEVKNGRLHVRERAFDAAHSGPLFRFPNHLVACPKDKAALLTFGACGDGPGQMYELIKKVFQGIRHPDTEAIEAQHRVKKDHWRIIRTQGNGEVDRVDYRHEAIRVSLIDSESYILDLAGAQYAREWFTGPPNLGWRANHNKEVLEGKHDDMIATNYDFRVPQIQAELTKRMNTAVQQWEKANDKTLTLMLKEKRASFEANKDALIAAVTHEMRDYVDWTKTEVGVDSLNAAMDQMGLEERSKKPKSDADWFGMSEQTKDLLRKAKANRKDISFHYF